MLELVLVAGQVAQGGEVAGEGVGGDVLAAEDGLGELQPVLEVLQRDQGRRTTLGFFGEGLRGAAAARVSCSGSSSKRDAFT